MKLNWSHLQLSYNSLSGSLGVKKCKHSEVLQESQTKLKYCKKLCKKEFQLGDYCHGEHLIKLLPRGKKKTMAQISSWGGCFRLVFWKLKEKNWYQNLLILWFSARIESVGVELKMNLQVSKEFSVCAKFLKSLITI